MCQHIWTCRHVLICADMCWYVPTCDITLGTCDTNHLELICISVCVSTCGHVDMCWYVPSANMCWHVPTCDITLGTSDTNHLDLTSKLACVSTCGHADMCCYVPTYADMCRHVPTCTITLGISDTNPLELICVLACVSTFGHADMCWYVPTCTNMYHHPRHLWYQQCGPYLHAGMCHCPACRTTFIATRFRVAVICPIIPVPHCIRVFFYFVWFVFI